MNHMNIINKSLFFSFVMNFFQPVFFFLLGLSFFICLTSCGPHSTTTSPFSPVDSEGKNSVFSSTEDKNGDLISNPNEKNGDGEVLNLNARLSISDSSFTDVAYTDCTPLLNNTLRTKHRQRYGMVWRAPALQNHLNAFLDTEINHSLLLSVGREDSEMIYIPRVLEANGRPSFYNVDAYTNLYYLIVDVSVRVLRESLENFDPLSFQTLMDSLGIEKPQFCSNDEWRNYAVLYLGFMFIRSALTTAWMESRWQHYEQYYGPNHESNKILLRDIGIKEGHASYGIMQIFSYYHGVHDDLRDNLEQGLSYLFSSFHQAIQLHNTRLSCSEISSSNARKDEIGVLRRTYAGYNGGLYSHGYLHQGVCRDDDWRDNNFEKSFIEAPWEESISL